MSLVEIISMLIPSRASVPNIVEATPLWLFIPTPTTETFAIRSSRVIPLAPIPAAVRSRARTARAQSSRDTVNETSV